MNQKLMYVVMFTLAVGLVGNAYAHKSEIVGDYKIEVGWKNEPPVAGIENAIEVVVSHATDFEKEQSKSEDKHSHDDESMDMDHGDESSDMEGDMPHSESTEKIHEAEELESEGKDHDEGDHEDAMEHDEEHAEHEAGERISGLSNSLNVWITSGDAKTKLSLVESPEFPGVYHAEYMPTETGHPVVDIHGTIKTTDIDVQMHPEEVEPLSTLPPLKQMKNGIEPAFVQCREGLGLFMRILDESAVCISPQLSERLMVLGIVDYF